MASGNWKEVPVDGGNWKEVPLEEESKPEPMGAGKAFLTSAAEGLASIGGGGLGQALNPGGAAKYAALKEQAKNDQPLASAAGNLVGSVPLAAATAGLPGAAAGGLFGLLSAPTPKPPREGTGVLEQMTEGVKAGGAPILNTLAGAGMGALATKFPSLFGLGLTGAGLATKDPELLVGGALSAGLGGLGALGKVVQLPGKAARAAVLEDLVKEALPAAKKATNAENAATVRGLKDRFRLLQRSVEPVTGGPVAQGAAAPADLESTALGKLGAEAQENYRYLRSKDPLSLKLTPEAEAGVQALLPDYEAQANEALGRFAQGKDARLKQILANLAAETQGAGPKNADVARPSHLGFFPNPELLPTSGTLKPNPLAGFMPKPAPTAESLAPSLEGKVPERLAEMQEEKGIVPRLLGGAAKAAMNPIIGGGLGGAYLLGRPEMAGVAGAFGAGNLLARDPVLATKVLEPVGRVLAKGGPTAERISRFLMNAKGPELLQKLKFLMQHEPELKHGE